MDIEISRWVLEFILSQSLEDNILNALISVLPLPTDDVRLKKALILRKAQSEVSNGFVTEKVLEFLEFLEELYNQEGIEASEAMKTAYCAVAVDCTVRFLKESDKLNYIEAVKRIWKRRINKTGKNVGVVSEELWKWRDDIEEAVWDDKCANDVILRSESIAAVDEVKAFVKEAKESIGPPFLEVMAEILKCDDGVKACLGWKTLTRDDEVKTGWENKECGEPGRSIESLSNAGQDDRGHLVSTDIYGYYLLAAANKGNALLRLKHVAFKRTRGTPTGVCGGLEIADSAEATHGQDDVLPTPKIVDAQEALKLSSLELRAVVKDPLPEALELAETLVSLGRDNSVHQPAENSNRRALLLVVDSNGVVQGGNEDDQHGCQHNAAPKPSLMARNNTAHTFEWNDSIDNLSEGSQSSGRRLASPSPRRMKVSPLKKYEFKKVTTRRKAKRWSVLEEDTLRSGVQKYGVGNWKLIFDTYREVFEDRTPVDLKDKWRNLT